MHEPHVFDKNEISFAKKITETESDSISDIIEFSVSEEEFLRAFGAQAARIAMIVADGHEIWKYSVKNCIVSVAINNEGKINFYNLSFETEVNVIINGKKFAFKAEVTDVFTIFSEAQGRKIEPPQNAESYKPYTHENTK